MSGLTGWLGRTLAAPLLGPVNTARAYSAEKLRRDVIAEGVETVEHGRRLLRLGCDLAQGYGIAPPMPPERIPAWVAGWTPPSAWADSTGRTDI